jgi:serine O-acetyltransferase
MSEVEASLNVPDWDRERKFFFEWSPPKSLLATIRRYQKYRYSKNPIFIFVKKFTVIQHRFWSVVTGADIPLNSNLGGGLMIPHPNGIVIHPSAKVGPNCLIFQQVTLGTREGEGVPVIGAHVDIGAGAKILGDVKIGNCVSVGANSVVIEDLPDGVAAVGIPAKIVTLKARAGEGVVSKLAAV